jgi:protein disulfide-isomerase
MKRFFSILFASCLLASSQMEAALNWSNNYAESIERSNQLSKPVLIFFTGTGWCSWCTKLEREVLETAEFSRIIDDQFIFLKADFPHYSPAAMAASPYKPLMDRYGVDGFPTIVVVDSRGNKLFSMGYEAGGPQKYAQKLLQNLRATQR